MNRIDGHAMRSDRYDITDIAAQKFAMLDRARQIAPFRRQSHVVRPEGNASLTGFGHGKSGQRKAVGAETSIGGEVAFDQIGGAKEGGDETIGRPVVKVHRRAELLDTPQVRGMIQKVQYLVKVEG